MNVSENFSLAAPAFTIENERISCKRNLCIICDREATTSWQTALRDIAAITPRDSYRTPPGTSWHPQHPISLR